MNNIVEQTAINKIITNIDEAITDVGGDTSKAEKPCDYSDIIREQLVVKGGELPIGELAEGPGIVISKKDNIYTIAATGEALTTIPLSPTYPNDEDIPAGTPIQDILVRLFDVILPSIPSLLKGDIITAASNGTDQYNHPKFGDGITSGLNPNEKYIRMFIFSQKEPIYINCQGLGGGSVSDITVSDVSSDALFTTEDASSMFDEIFLK